MKGFIYDVAYLSVEDIVSIHQEQIALTPLEPAHILDRNLLASAQQRPAQQRYYEQGSDIFDLAASLAYGLINNHCFANANKRTAAASCTIFLFMNGYMSNNMASDEEFVVTFENVANKSLSQQELADWLRRNHVAHDITQQSK